jgi:hypothetical protein
MLLSVRESAGIDFLLTLIGLQSNLSKTSQIFKLGFRRLRNKSFT